jgi:hypothetical protein
MKAALCERSTSSTAWQAYARIKGFSSLVNLRGAARSWAQKLHWVHLNRNRFRPLAPSANEWDKLNRQDSAAGVRSPVRVFVDQHQVLD